MNPDTGRLYHGAEAIRMATQRGEKLEDLTLREPIQPAVVRRQHNEETLMSTRRFLETATGRLKR